MAKVIDYKGVEYDSMCAMCAAYGISVATFRYRIGAKWSLEEALITPIKDLSCEDHLGNKFKNIVDMCKCWGVDYNLFRYRLNVKGWSLERSLTEPNIEKVVLDHLGNEFPTIRAMCRYYGVSSTLYTRLKRKGLSLEEILTKEAFKRD